MFIDFEPCTAIDYSHAHGVVHCDIKPANTWVGTLAYMAPEQLFRDPTRERGIEQCALDRGQVFVAFVFYRPEQLRLEQVRVVVQRHLAPRKRGRMEGRGVLSRQILNYRSKLLAAASI